MPGRYSVSDKQYEILFNSAADNSLQPALLYQADSKGPRPVLVALHTWSFDHLSCSWEPYLKCCQERGWHLIYPAFRGANDHPEACGSELVVSDIVGVLEYVRKNCLVAESQIYLAGGSGGGHAALLMAGRHPELWSAVSVWCPITDIGLWHRQCTNQWRTYHDHIERVCQGDPQTDPAAANEAAKRSPATYLASAMNKTVIDINAGIHDGHTGSVPVSHSFMAYNLLCAPEDRFSSEEIDFIVQNEQIPEHLIFRGENDSVFAEQPILLRRTSRQVRISIFEGSHDILPHGACAWLANQDKSRDPNWQVCRQPGAGKVCALTY